jgi:hypothetical protein
MFPRRITQSGWDLSQRLAAAKEGMSAAKHEAYMRSQGYIPPWEAAQRDAAWDAKTPEEKEAACTLSDAQRARLQLELEDRYRELLNDLPPL